MVKTAKPLDPYLTLRSEMPVRLGPKADDRRIFFGKRGYFTKRSRVTELFRNGWRFGEPPLPLSLSAYHPLKETAACISFRRIKADQSDAKR